MERAYTVAEIDALRQCVEDRYLFGTCAGMEQGGMSRQYREHEMAVAVEEQLRTHMMAGHTADDLIEADKNKLAAYPNV